MGDELNGCECIWSHEFAMQRLLAFIRQNQDHCTDTDCIDPLARLPNPSLSGNENQNFVWMSAFMMIALLMMFVRPSSLFKGRANQGGSRNNDSHQPPPPAPPAIH